MMQDPHAALNDAAAIQLQQQEKNIDQRITTLGYHCAGWNFLVCNGVMAEVLPLPKLNTVPRSPNYCWGICNIRGNITPVFDLSEKLTGSSEFQARDTFYVLLQGKGANRVGIVVNRIPRSMHFNSTNKAAQVSHLPEELHEYVKDIYLQENDVWHELDIASLLKAA